MSNIKENRKVLFVATVNSHIINFHIPYLKLFKEQGYEVHVCTGEKGEILYCDKKYEISIKRNPYNILNNIKAIFELNKILDINNYKIIHCHTPMGSVVTRLSAKKARKNGTRIIYTAHGFHFYKGAPLLNWLIYYPIEKFLSKYTDTLITINSEDYEIAKKKFQKCNEIKLVNGVGFNTEKFNIEITEKELENLRKKIDIKKEDIVLSYVAELNKNKNQILLIKSIQELIKQDKKYKLLLIGEGKLKQKYQKYIKENKLENNIFLLGSRKDIPQLLSITDIYVASSIREGLPVNIMEAMYMGLPMVATDNRGHRELIIDKKNGFLTYSLSNQIEFCDKIKNVALNKKTAKIFAINSKLMVKKFKIKEIKKSMEDIYKFTFNTKI